MAWHNIMQAQKLTNRSRRSLYRDMATGRVSWRSGLNGGREIETSELIRVYGELSQVGTTVRHTVARAGGTHESDELIAEVKALRAEIAELKQTILRIEFKPQPNEQIEKKKKKWWDIFGR